MKTFYFLSIFFLITSCNTSTSKEKEAPLLPPAKTIEVTPRTEKVVEKNVLDTVVTLKEEQITSDTESIKKQIVPIKKETIKQPVVNEQKVIAKKIIEEKAPIIETKQVKANHDIWNKLVKTNVSASGKVNYKNFKNELSTIEKYLLHLQNTSPTKSWSKNEKLAYWFNLYNASTVHLVASNYPVKSIKDINGGKPWDKKFIKSGSNVYSLNDIENTLVRPNYNEPRLHVAFNCAAVSCPNLLNEAFTPSKLNTQLNSLSKKWINDVSKNSISPDQIEISKIFDWYKVDFKEGVIPFINKHNNVKIDLTAKITYLEYDWKLNE